jgi:hypothetical protein
MGGLRSSSAACRLVSVNCRRLSGCGVKHRGRVRTGTRGALGRWQAKGRHLPIVARNPHCLSFPSSRTGSSAAESVGRASSTTAPQRCPTRLKTWFRRWHSGAAPLLAAISTCRSAVRFIIGISLLLLGFGLFACQVEGVSARSSTADFTMPWVRTVDGWERQGSWTVSAVGPPAVNPLVVAAGQTLASILALAFFQRDSQAGDLKC